MIQQIITYSCPKCGSVNLVKNGHNKVGSQQAHCQDCGAYFVLTPKQTPGATTRQVILKTAVERCSLRGLERIVGVTRQTIAKWIEAVVRALPPFRQTILPAQPDDVLELDEAWSVVGKKDQQRWLWTVMCRRTRQLIAFVIGDHGETAHQERWYNTLRQRLARYVRKTLSFLKSDKFHHLFTNGVSLNIMYHLPFNHYRLR